MRKFTSESRAVYEVTASGRIFLFDALSIIAAITAAHWLNDVAGAHRCSEHLVPTDHDLISKCSVCGVEYA
jgi:hypothetical protein